MIDCNFDVSVTDATDAEWMRRLYSQHPRPATAAFYVAFTFWSADTGADKTHNGERRLAAVVSFQENKLTTGCLELHKYGVGSDTRVPSGRFGREPDLWTPEGPFLFEQ